MDLGLSRRTALVLGSTSGLGRAIADGLATEGARVAFCGRRTEMVASAAAAHPGSIGVGIDLTDPESTAAALDTVDEEFGHVDVLVLNSGGPPPGTAAELTSGQLAESLQTLVLTQMDLVARYLPGMRERGWGRIVAVGSSGMQQPIPGLARSNASRAALAGYLKTLSAEVAGDGVTVNMVLPGKIDTDRLAQIDNARAGSTGADIEDVRAQSQASIPIGRYGRPEEFGAAAVFLCGEPAGYITGIQLRVDGGAVGSY
ncbi:SDR family oxidoreductase [Actinomycetes bacterium KLBMP 9759]